MRILLFSNPLAGHLLPLLPLARALRRQGHAVAFASSAGMAASVEPEGFGLIPVGPTTDEVLAEVNRRTGADLRKGATAELAGEFFAGVRVELCADEALAGAADWAPDLIVSEHLDFVGPLVAATLKVPAAAVAVDPGVGTALLDALVAAARPRYLERGLQAPSRAPFARWVLDLCPPSLQDARTPTPPGRIALRPEPHQGPEGAPRAPRAPGTGRPRVLVSFSTTAATPGLGPVLRSLSTLDIDLVATTGGAPHDGFGLQPGRAELVSFRPAAELLDGVAAVVHHGGSGTTFGTAARGIPAVVVPGQPGQQSQAKRVEAAGAGLALPMGEQEPAAVAAAVGRVLAEPAFTAAAHRLRDEIAAMPSADEAAERFIASVAG